MLNRTDGCGTVQFLFNFVQDLIQATRYPGLFVYGISPRAGLAVVRASKAWALMNGRNHVEPGDVKAVFGSLPGKYRENNSTR